MKHQIIYITGLEDWEMIYLDGEQYLQGHRIGVEEVLEMVAGLTDACEITIYEAEDIDALEEYELFFYRTHKLRDIQKILDNKKLFEKRKLV